MLLKTVRVMKNKGRLRNSYRPGKTKEKKHRQCGVLDWILGQKRNTGGKTGEFQIKSGV